MEHKIIYTQLPQIIPNDKNPKEHDIEEIIRSFQRFGFTNPLIVDSNTNKLVAGHGRLQALIYLQNRQQQAPDGIRTDGNGFWYVPTIERAFLNENEAMAYIIADNKLTEIGNWDNDKLSDMVNELLDNDVNLTDGIGIYNLNEFIDELNQLETTAKDTVETNPEAYEAQYLVVVVAQNEKEQENLFVELTERGHECRILS